MDEKHCCRRAENSTPSSSSVHGSRNERLECKLRRLNVIYRWDRLLHLELPPPPPQRLRPLLPPPPSSTDRASLLANPAAAASGSVTKRSRRRRRRQRIGDFDSLAETLWPPWSDGLSGAADGVGDASSCSKKP